MTKIAYAIAILISVFNLNAHATEVTVVPMAPTDCMQKAVRDVSQINVTPSQNGDEMTFTFMLTYGTCHQGQHSIAEVVPDFNLYLVNYEYSRDFKYTIEPIGKMSVFVTARLSLKEFFAQYTKRNFDLTFYPTPNRNLEFGWKLTFVQDPINGSANLIVESH